MTLQNDSANNGLTPQKPEPSSPPSQTHYVSWFRSTSPYINAHRSRTFVVALGGEAVLHPNFNNIIHDLALLNSLGIRLVVVHGARPQINESLAQLQIEPVFVQGRRVTDAQSLNCVLNAAGKVRIQIEALLSMGVANSPMHGASIEVCSGNFVIARPYGVRDGMDFQHTGEVRRINTDAMQRRLKENAIVLVSHVGYSPTGEVFNLSWEEVAEKVATELNAEKLIFFAEPNGIEESGRLVREMTVAQAKLHLTNDFPDDADQKSRIESAIRAAEKGVKRCHFISYQTDGALLQELFTRDGNGTLLTQENFERLRNATVEDVGGILELIEPLEQEGILVRRSRELLEQEIAHFTVVERDGMIIGCAALYPYTEDQMGELACVAIHRQYQNGKRGDALLDQIERRAKTLGINALFVLTTRTAHWFRERGFEVAELNKLPLQKQQFYNLQRKSNVFVKRLE